MYRFPFPAYPLSWYQVALSSQVKKGQIFPVEYFGKKFVLFRTEKGQLGFVDAYCPHLGANIGLGGKVVGENIQCPFHGWKFNTAGKCTEIPYCDKIPSKAQFKVYPIKEINQAIFIYYSENNSAPMFELPQYDEFYDSEWSSVNHISYEIKSHVQEMAENALDMAHFPLIHDYRQVPKITDLSIEGANLKVQFKGKRKILAYENKFDVTLNVLGLGVVFAKTITDLVKVRATHSVTPINESLLKVTVSFVFHKSWNPLYNIALQKFLPGEIYRFTNGDRKVLANKEYKKNPTLCREDGPIMQLRRWAKQFYELPQEERKVASA